MTHVTKQALYDELASIMAAPKDAQPVDMLCLRPDFGKRSFVDEIKMTQEHGIPGERWGKTPWLTLPDGSADPRIQVSILQKRVLDLVWTDRQNVVHPGDTMICDIDLSEANMPAGTLLQCGSAVLRVSTKFNDACVKWKVRYGADALDFVRAPEHVPLRLRGVLCEIVEDGSVRTGDRLTKM